MAPASEGRAKTGATRATRAKRASKPLAKAAAKTQRAASAKNEDGPEGVIVVKQVRSGIGAKPKHRGTLRALGLGRVGRTHQLPDRPEIRGMVATVTHLVEFRTEQGQGR